MTQKTLGTILILAALLIVSACSSHPKRIDCEGTLRPINAPAPVTQPKATAP